jgi:uncharacterized protein
MDRVSLELKRAASRGDLDRVRALVEEGADINATDEHGSGTLLTFHPDVMEYLLSRGADPNRQTNESGDPILCGVAYFNSVKCVRLLLEAGADPNALVNDTAETALHGCVIGLGQNVTEADRHEVVKLLIGHGADPNRRTVPGRVTLAFWRDVRTRGETPLHRAAAYASEETIRFLLDA